MSITDRIDIAFIQKTTASGAFYYDLEVDTDGDLKSIDSLDTATLMSLLTDSRATGEEIQEAGQRRGWWGNLFNDDPTFEIGSKLWLDTNQGRITQLTLNNINDKALLCLEWLKTDNLVKDIEVTSALTGSNKIQLNIKFFIESNILEKSFILWENSQWR